MARTAVLGFPRIGAERELKLALEDHWTGRASRDRLDEIARTLRAENLRRGAGIDVLPVGDFALYDHVLDTAEMAGIVADRHRGDHFLACRGAAGVTPLEMTKWFDTNYHYLVPELRDGQPFALDASKWVEHLREARELGAVARPVVVGPFTLLTLGADEVQLDEPRSSPGPAKTRWTRSRRPMRGWAASAWRRTSAGSTTAPWRASPVCRSLSSTPQPTENRTGSDPFPTGGNQGV